MKKLIAILMGVALMSFCSAAFAETVLTDGELGELYAGKPNQGGGNQDKDDGVNIVINEVKDLDDSAAAAQSNIGAVLGEGTSADVNLIQTNNANVANKGGEIKFIDIDKTKNIDITKTKTISKFICKSDNDTTTTTTNTVSVSDSFNKVLSDNTLDLAVTDSLNSTPTTTTTTTTTSNTTTVDDIYTALCGSNIATKGAEIATTGGNTGKVVDIVDISSVDISSSGGQHGGPGGPR